MATAQSFLYTATLWLCFFISGSCSAKTSTAEIVLVGSTPGDASVKAMLSIPADTKVDFIRWHLKLDGKNFFVLNLAFGESQPNTLDFKSGGAKRTITGTFTVSKKEKHGFKEIYHLKSSSVPGISLAKLNENLFHLLTPQNQLIPGNGGWSYSLNRKDPVDANEVLIASPVSDNKRLQLVFEGRTPCQEIAAEHPEMKAGPSCFKLKWRLILNRDPVNYLPATYALRKVVNNIPRDVSGNWTIINGTPANPDAVIYKMDPDKPDESISFLVGDDNVLFFLDKNNKPYIGNEDFSYTLNKKMEIEHGK